MVQRSMLIMAGVGVLGLILLIVGAYLEPLPTTDVTRPGTSIVDNLGQALIALGLTFVTIAVGLVIVWGAETARAAGRMLP